MNLELREYLTEIDDELILLDELDGAIIGLAERCGLYVVAYDKDKIIHIIMDKERASEEEALEYYKFNILDAYVGEKTPIVVENFDI